MLNYGQQSAPAATSGAEELTRRVYKSLDMRSPNMNTRIQAEFDVVNGKFCLMEGGRNLVSPTTLLSAGVCFK